MALIKNTAQGVRIFNVKAGDGQTQYVLNPGESVDAADVELFDPGNAVYRGWVAAGEMEFPDGLLVDPKAKGRKAKETPVAAPAPAQPVVPTPAPGGPGAPLTQSAPAPAPGTTPKA